ncbi:MAG: glycosyltransferase, partial [Candidatus Lokiarchaeota archaeon]|nr:glycosyltransferase [Candidatus Lokiarchaeota archaeon]
FYKINKKKIIFIPNGVDKTFYCESKKNFNTKKLNIVFYNGFDNEIDRGLKNILKVLNELANIEFTLFVIGNNLDDFGKFNNYEIRNVETMNEIELIEFLKDKHIFLKSTTYDSFPIMVLECMAAGLIVIISNKVGITSYIKNGKNGFVYSNLSEVKGIMENIYNNNINLSLISDNAKAICIELNWKAISINYIKLYQDLTNEI